MPVNIAGIAENAANDVIGTAMGLALEGHNDRRQLRQQGKLQNLQIQGQKEMTDYNMMKQLEMWKATSYGAQKEQMKLAGINPALLYGMSGGGGATTGSANGSVSGAEAPKGGGEAMGMGIQMMNMQLMKAQKELIEAQRDKEQAIADKTKGADTENTKADTALKLASEVIAKYTGMDAKDTYERVKAPARGVEAKTYQDELEARQGLAGTIYELWSEGKLKEKSNAEIEQILLQNSKTREETRNIVKSFDILEENLKGAQLDNIIKDLEVKLQQETGLDKDAPTWMKILGRLFLKFK